MISKDFEKSLRDIAIQSDPVEDVVQEKEPSEFKNEIDLNDVSV